MDSKFKVGDKVRRIKDSWADMKPGDIGTIEKLDYAHLYFKEFDGGHDIDYFELVETNNMNKKFKNKFAVTGSKHLLKAFAEELEEIGYTRSDRSHGMSTYLEVNWHKSGGEMNGKYSFSSSTNNVYYVLPQDYNKALELAKEVEEVIPEYVKCVVQWGWNKVDFQKGTIYKTSEQPKDITWEEVFHSYPDDFIPTTKEEYEAQFKLFFGDKEVKVYKVNNPGDLVDYAYSWIKVECAGEVGTLEQVQAIVDYVEFNKNKSFKFGSKDIAISHSQTRVSMSKPLKFTDEELKFIIGCQTGTLAQAKKILEAGNKLK
jgi:hypothetical protein